MSASLAFSSSTSFSRLSAGRSLRVSNIVRVFVAMLLLFVTGATKASPAKRPWRLGGCPYAVPARRRRQPSARTESSAPRRGGEHEEHAPQAPSLEIVPQKPHEPHPSSICRCFLPPKGGICNPCPYTEPVTVVDTERHHESLVEELIAAVEAYNPRRRPRPDPARVRVRRARARGQQRRSGEEFIHHPLGVARICAELQLDEQTIAAALLHDVVEDTGRRPRRGARRVRRRDRAARRRRHQADADPVPEPRAGARPRTTAR